MSSAIGLRDQRLRLYARTDQGTDGFVQSAFVLDSERWGRVDESSASSRVMQAKLGMKVDGMAEFADEVVVPAAGILVNAIDVESDGTVLAGWWIRSITTSRALRRAFVGLERISEDKFKEITFYDQANQLDGVPLVEPISVTWERFFGPSIDDSPINADPLLVPANAST